MKKIITHINPDNDAIASVWLIKKFLPGWQEARIEFIPTSATTEKNFGVDQDPNILYVDVGRGKLDHHQTGEFLSAVKLCWDYIQEKRQGQKFNKLDKKAIKKLIKVETEIDNGQDVTWEETNLDRHEFYFHCLVFGLRGLAKTDEQVMSIGLELMEAVFLNLKNKIRAEEELKQGTEFQTPWGKAIALETGNTPVLWKGEAQGYVLVIKKDPESGRVQIYSRYDCATDLTKAYKRFKELDPESDWYLHPNKRLLLNQSAVNPGMRPTKLTLEQLIGILKK